MIWVCGYYGVFRDFTGDRDGFNLTNSERSKHFYSCSGFFGHVDEDCRIYVEHINCQLVYHNTVFRAGKNPDNPLKRCRVD